jgi:hypothetical protein
MKIRFLEAYSYKNFSWVAGDEQDIHRTKANQLIQEGIVEPVLV